MGSASNQDRKKYPDNAGDNFVFDDIGDGDWYRTTRDDIKRWAGNFAVASIQDLLNEDLDRYSDGDVVDVINFYPDVEGGGDPFDWDANGDKADHNGITIVDPTHSTTPGQPGWWTSENTGTTGVFRRREKGFVRDKDAGIKVDNSTINTSAYQAVLDYLHSSGGGILTLSEGTSLIDEPIYVGDNTTVMGTGWGCIIKATGTPFTSTDNVIIGNKDSTNGNSNIYHYNYTLDCNNIENSDTDSRSSGIATKGCNEWTIEKVKVINATGYNIVGFEDDSGNPGVNGEIKGCYSENGEYNIELLHCTDSIISNNICKNVSGRTVGGIHLRGGTGGYCQRIDVSDNIVTGDAGKGIDFLNGLDDSSFSDNIVRLSGSGIDEAFTAQVDDGTSSNNVNITGGVYKCDGGDRAVLLSSWVRNVDINDVTVEGDKNGILIEGGESEHININNSTIVVNDVASNGTCYGIRLSDNGDYNVKDNDITINNIDATTTDGVYLDSTKCNVEGNTLNGCDIAASSNATSKRIVNNTLYNGTIRELFGLNSDDVIKGNSPTSGQKTFTPTIQGATTAGSFTYSTQEGYIMRDGEDVKVWIEIVISTIDSAPSGNLQITGLPLPNRTGFIVTASGVMVPREAVPTGLSEIKPIIQHDNDFIEIYYTDESGSYNAYDSADISANAIFRYTTTYRVDVENYPTAL